MHVPFPWLIDYNRLSVLIPEKLFLKFPVESVIDSLKCCSNTGAKDIQCSGKGGGDKANWGTPRVGNKRYYDLKSRQKYLQEVKLDFLCIVVFTRFFIKYNCVENI